MTMTIIKKVKLIPWTNPYATAGLIAMWDGIWNSGSDRHLTNSSNCIDVISGRHLPVQPMNDDAFIVPNSTTFKDIDLSGDMTIEWVLDTTEEFIHDLFFAYGSNAERMVTGAITGGMPAHCVYHFDSHEQMAKMLKNRVRAGDLLLFKGSRGMRMEHVLHLFLGKA